MKINALLSLIYISQIAYACILSLSFLPLSFISSMDHMQTMIELRSECEDKV